MAIINCDECGRDVSDKAAQCVGCGAPIETNGSNRGVQTIQRTSKVYKAQLLIAGFLFLAGVAMMIATGTVGVYLHGPAAGVTLPPGVAIIGLIWFVCAWLAAWWNHG